jgi:hypothetical protein
MHSQHAESKVTTAFILAAVACLIVSPFAGAVTDARTELESAFNTLKEVPSTDPAPVTFSINDAQYKVPRNFLMQMEHRSGGPQTLVALKVAFPDFAPLTDANRRCLTAAPAYRPRGCFPIEFVIVGAANARIEFYVKHVRDHLLVIKCFLNESPRPIQQSVCAVSSRLAGDNELEYRFYLNQLSDAENMDHGIRHLIGSFVYGPGNPVPH